MPRRMPLLGLLLLAACGAPEEQPARQGEVVPAPPPAGPRQLHPVGFDQLPGWSRDSLAGLETALARSCQAVLRKPESANLGAKAGLTLPARLWHGPCQALAEGAPVRSVVERHFQPYWVTAGERQTGVFTGYFVATLRGSPVRTADFSVPIHGRPAGWSAPPANAPDRAAITAGVLEGQAPVLVWVDDPVEAFLLHVQGSGVVVMPDGQRLGLGYAGDNGHDYRSIGKVLIDRGAIPREQMSMPALKDWLARHPDQRAEVLNANPRYIFFQPRPVSDPVGAAGVPLVAGRSLAVDPTSLPYHAPVWLDVSAPPGLGTPRLQRLMMAQDTGGAIKGVIRGDVFWGVGDRAAALAGAMNSRGGYAVLLPRGASGLPVSAPAGPRPEGNGLPTFP